MKLVFNCDEKKYHCQDLYDLLQSLNFSEMDTLRITLGENNTLILEISDGELNLLQMVLTEKISESGLEEPGVFREVASVNMEDRKLNELGEKLYWIYDQILVKEKQKK